MLGNSREFISSKSQSPEQLNVDCLWISRNNGRGDGNILIIIHVWKEKGFIN